MKNDSDLLARMRRLIDEQSLAIENEAWDLALSMEEEKRHLLEEALKYELSPDLINRISEQLLCMKSKVEHELSNIRSLLLDIRKRNIRISKPAMGYYLSASA